MKNDTLGLYGPEDSKYLRLVARRAAAKGIKTAWVAGPTPGCVAYVADMDAGWPMWDLSPEEDVDNIKHPGLSCCAEGALRYIYSSPGWRVCIIGRGHAVQGLGEGRVDAYLTALRCLDAFERDHNLEHLVDAANYLMFRFSFPLPGDYFRATDSDGSVGTVGTPINMERGDFG